MSRRRSVGRVAKRGFAAAAVALIAGLTLVPHPGDRVREGVFCLACGSTGGVDLLLNVGLFVPLGAALWLLTHRWSVAVAVGFALSVSVETMQGLFIAGRDATVSDLLANTLGAWVGAHLARHTPTLLNPSTAVARHLARYYALLTALMLTAVSIVFTPVIPYQKLFVQWQPKREGFDTLQGDLRTLRLNGSALEKYQVLDPTKLPYVDSSETLHLTADVSLWMLSRRIAPVARLANQLHETVGLAMARGSALFRVETRAARLRLRVPHAAVRCAPAGAQTPSPERPWELVLAGALRDRAIRIECGAGPTGRAVVRTVHLRPALFWTLLWPRQIILGPTERATSAAFLLLMLLPLGFWWSVARVTSPGTRQVTSGLWMLALPVAVLIATVTRDSVGVISGDVAGAAAGIALGVLVARLDARTRQGT